MKDIQYFDILKQSLRITWANKFLWIFGLLILSGSLISETNANFSRLSGKSAEIQSATKFVQDHPGISSAAGLAAVVILVAFFLLRLVATAGLIKSANNIAVYKQSKIIAILVEVKRYVWILLGLEVVISVALAVVLLLLLVPIAYLFALKAGALSVISIGIALLIFIPLSVIAYYLRKFAYFYIILGDMKMKMALESAYSLLLKNIEKSLVMGIVAIIAGISSAATALALLMVLAVAVAPFAALLYFMVAKTGAIIVSTMGAILGAAMLLALFSWYISFAQMLWVLFFQQVSLDKYPQEKKQAEKIEADMKMAGPEAV